MLLFQWGTYDWGHGPHFEVDLTRELIRHGAEDVGSREDGQVSIEYECAG